MKKIEMVVILILILPCFSSAYENAPRISDREIVESLTELKQDQKATHQRIDDMIRTFDQRFEGMNKRFEGMNKRFDDMNKRSDDMNYNLNKRFEAINIRLDDMNHNLNKRFEDMHNMILTLFGSVMALIVALIGYMIWDRKTAHQPLKSKIGKLENNYDLIESHLETTNPSGPVVTRMLTSFRELARTNEEVAEILRANFLL